MPSYTVHLTAWSANSTIGTATWFNPGNAQNVDASIAKTNGLVGTANTYYLFGQSPSSISPAGNEIISSIVATVTRACAGGTATDNVLALVVGGSATGTNKAIGGSWPATLTAQAYTWSSADLAGLGISLATVGAANFGVALSASLDNPTGSGAEVDAIVLTVNTSYACLGGGNRVIPPYGVR